MGEIDGVFPVDPNKTERCKQGRDLTDRPEIDKRCPRAQADLGFPSLGSKAVDIGRVKHTVFTSGDMDENTMWCHTHFVARLGHDAH